MLIRMIKQTSQLTRPYHLGRHRNRSEFDSQWAAETAHSTPSHRKAEGLIAYLYLLFIPRSQKYRQSDIHPTKGVLRSCLHCPSGRITRVSKHRLFAELQCRFAASSKQVTKGLDFCRNSDIYFWFTAEKCLMIAMTRFSSSRWRNGPAIIDCVKYTK